MITENDIAFIFNIADNGLSDEGEDERYEKIKEELLAYFHNKTKVKK